MKKKIIIVPILVLIIIGLVWYLTPKTFAKGVNPDDVKKSVFSMARQEPGLW